MKSSYEEVEKEDFEGVRAKGGEKSILYRYDIDPCNTD
jgi:hypothetical protein